MTVFDASTPDEARVRQAERLGDSVKSQFNLLEKAEGNRHRARLYRLRSGERSPARGAAKLRVLGQEELASRLTEVKMKGESR